ncbi:hypothetical protein ETAA8_70690 [Anatilimnocola aggregata]|uniref:Uncharacterized protein n=1 Tax=Anatilimnocola aggregata TaxID=2528021 RepID=A0A517YNV6_9BACT|nr:hypothetical protein [Anatilimnocola aggregata]QDU31907.1 hypothetical protein ETAA8_70690 [Anatilimnocola aggregata]
MSSAQSPNTSNWPAEFAHELAVQKAKTAALELELVQLREQLKKHAGNESQLDLVSEEAIAESLRVAREMFGNEPSIEVLVDPEMPEFPFLVVTVKGAGTTAELLEKRLEWHRRVEPMFAGPFNYPRLSVVFD